MKCHYCVRTTCAGRDGRTYQLFAVRYEYDGGQWEGELWALDWQDAEARLRALQGASVDSISRVDERGPWMRSVGGAPS